MRIGSLLVSLAVCMVLAAGSADANDVVVKLSAGKLKLTGDAESNVLRLDQAGLGPLQIRVTGESGTTINGVAGSAVLDEVTDVAIDLGDGGDSVLLQSVSLSGKLAIKLGPGRDGLSIRASGLGGKVSIDGGGDDDGIAVCDSAFASALTIKTGVSVGGAIAAACGTITAAGVGTAIVVGGSALPALVIKGGKGSETVRMANTVVVERSIIALGAGGGDVSACDSVLGAAVVKVGSAGATLHTASCGGLATTAVDNAVVVAGVGFDALSVKGSSADDSVVTSAINVAGPVAVDLGKGANVFAADTPFAGGRFVAKGGAGIDLFTVQTGTFQDDVVLSAGGGNNIVTVSSAGPIGGDLLVKTGDGDDVVVAAGASALGTKVIKHGKGNDTVVQ